MKWRSIVLVAFLAGSVNGFAQNLVPNGGFEEGINCPTFIANLDEECSEWYFSIIPEDDQQPTPDWFHECSEIDALSPPQIAFGFQEPAEGQGYAGVVTYRVASSSPDYREIIGVQLSQVLELGHQYLVEFKLSSLETAGYFLVNDKIGFNFSTHPTYNRENFPYNQSHFAIDTIVTLSEEWTQVSVLFEADSAYQYLHIGNFYDDDNTNIILESELSQSGYYVIDEVSVTESSLFANSLSVGKGFKIFPNPAQDRFTIQAPEGIAEYAIYNLSGDLLKSEKGYGKASLESDIAHLPAGVYVLHLTTQTQSYYERVVKL
jgi:hypothetical protein